MPANVPTMEEFDALKQVVESLIPKDPVLKSVTFAPTELVEGDTLKVTWEIENTSEVVFRVISDTQREELPKNPTDTASVNSTDPKVATVEIVAKNYKGEWVTLFSKVFSWEAKPAPVVNFSVYPILVYLNEPTTIAWDVVGADSVQLWIDGRKATNLASSGNNQISSPTVTSKHIGIGVNDGPMLQEFTVQWIEKVTPPPPPPPPPPPVTNAPWTFDLKVTAVTIGGVTTPYTPGMYLEVETDSFINVRMECTLVDGPDILNAGTDNFTGQWNVQLRCHDGFLWGIPVLYFHKPTTNDRNDFRKGQTRVFDGWGFTFRVPSQLGKQRFRYQVAWDTTYFLNENFNSAPDRGWIGPLVDIEFNVVPPKVPAEPLVYSTPASSNLSMKRDFECLGAFRPDENIAALGGQGFGSVWGSTSFIDFAPGQTRMLVHNGFLRDVGLCALTIPTPMKILARPKTYEEYRKLPVAWASRYFGKFRDVLPMYATDPSIVSGCYDPVTESYFYCVQDTYGNFPRYDDPGGNTLFQVKLDLTNNKMLPVGQWHLHHPQYKVFWWGPSPIPKEMADKYFDGRTLMLHNGGYGTQTQNGAFGPSFGVIDNPSVGTPVVPKTYLQYFWTGNGPDQAYFPRTGDYNLYSHPVGRQPLSRLKGFWTGSDTVQCWVPIWCKDGKHAVICFAQEMMGPGSYWYSYMPTPGGHRIVSYIWNNDDLTKLRDRNNETIPSLDIHPCERNLDSPFPGYVGGIPRDATFRVTDDGQELLYIWCQGGFYYNNISEPIIYVLRRK